MANQSKDPALISFFTSKESNDMHCFVAKKIYPELESLSDEEIKEKEGEKRNKAKQGGFCLNYNGSFKTLAKNLGILLSEAEFIYNKYFEVFHGLKREFEKRKAYCQNYGYIITNDVTKRRIYFDIKSINQDLMEINWDDYKLGKANYPKFIPYYNKIIHFDMIKLASIKFFKYIRDNNLLNIVLIPNIVHDELVTECPEEISEEIARVQMKCKLEAGKKFCKIVPVGIDIKISKQWSH